MQRSKLSKKSLVLQVFSGTVFIYTYIYIFIHSYIDIAYRPRLCIYSICVDYSLINRV